MRGQADPPDPEDVRIDVGHGANGDWNQYWVRGQLPLVHADQVVIVKGSDYDARRRKNNSLLGKCIDPEAIADLTDCLTTTTESRPFLMMPGTPTLAFLRGRSELLASVTIKDGRWISSTLWSGDAPLRDPQRFQDWLAQTIGH